MAAMDETPGGTDPEDQTDPDDTVFLTSLWDRLERAQEIAISFDVLHGLEEIRDLCEAVAAAITVRLGGSRP